MISLRRVFVSSPAVLRGASRPVAALSTSALWNDTKMAPKDPILGVSENFQADPFPGKINVGVGAYRDDDGKPWTLPSVKAAAARITDKNHEYAPIIGNANFVNLAVELAYGENSKPLQEGRVAALQVLSGTGALRLLAHFLEQNWTGNKQIFLPTPTWGNHFPIFEGVGFSTGKYRYWSESTKGLDLEGMLADLEACDDRSVVLLHSCAHNPTGVDPTDEQWAKIADVCKKKGHLVVFDNAYQGFASGDADKDIASVRFFVDQGFPVILSQSMAKNFGLYGHRIGCLSMICADKEEKDRVMSQLKVIARQCYSNPPVYGANIVEAILSDAELTAQWKEDIKTMADRIIGMRSTLKSEILALGSKHNWDHITNQIGMFSFTGLTPEQCDYVTKEHHVYLTKNGRISMAGVTSKNVKALAKALHEATK